ncbi:MAG TPA: DNA internalization-related competence protein ComEC/Rec2 [Gemmatimonadales bacterium]
MRPRPVILFTLAFGAGLATGLARFPGPPAVAALTGLAVALGGDAALVPLGGVLGFIHGAVARRAAATTCAARLSTGRVRLRVRLLEPGRPGLVEAEPIGAGCRGAILIRWPESRPRGAGSRVEIEGKWIYRERFGGRPDGILAAVRKIGPGRDGGEGRLRASLRAGIVERTSRLYGSRAPLVEALVLGRRGGLDPTLRDAFARSGLVHLLSISGFHVGLLATWLFLVLRLARLRRESAQLAAAAVSVGYVAFLGWPAPATRAAGLLVLLALCRVRQRRVQPAALLAVTCLAVLLLDPWALTDLGAWLSAAAIWGVVRFTRWSDRALGPHALVRTFFASLGATLATAPITAATLGTVALGGLLLNFVAIPLAGVAVPGIFASLALSAFSPSSPFSAVGDAVAAGTGLALRCLEIVARFGGALPGASLLVQPTPVAALPWLLVLGLVTWSLDDRWPWREAGRRGLWSSAAALWLLLVLPHVRGLGSNRPGLTLHLLDVGQGDAAAIRTPGARWVLIDAGPASETRDAGERVVTPLLRRRQARGVATLVVSHAHLDHLGGAGSLLEGFEVAAVVEPAVPVADSVYLAFLDAVEAEGARWVPARRGDAWELDGVRFSVLHPDTTWPGWREDLNEDSIVLLVEYGRFRALFPGDAGLPVEARLRNQVGQVDLLKVGHHGSGGATGRDWLAELAPRAAVISLGPNRYGHPHAATLRRLAEAGVPLWRTDQDGAVEVWTDGVRVEIRGRKRRQEYVIDD